MENRLLCLEKGVESDKGTSVAYFECSSYFFDRDRNYQTKVSAKMAVQFSCGFFSCFISYLCQYRDGEVERVISSSGLRSADFGWSSLKSDAEKRSIRKIMLILNVRDDMRILAMESVCVRVSERERE